MQGILSSREIIAAWHDTHHSSVTMALHFLMHDMSDGLLLGETSISHFSKCCISSHVRNIFTLPVTFPGYDVFQVMIFFVSPG